MSNLSKYDQFKLTFSSKKRMPEISTRGANYTGAGAWTFYTVDQLHIDTYQIIHAITFYFRMHGRMAALKSFQLKQVDHPYSHLSCSCHNLAKSESMLLPRLHCLISHFIQAF